ncbi:MAG: hypothetical protein ABI960_06840, partial [Candidatus Eisenbacteria bacterium]
GQAGRIQQVDGIFAPVLYKDASPGARTAVLAYLFERALASTPPSRARLVALRNEVERIDPAAGGSGRARLLALLSGALAAVPER